jgi:hypothetical protein
LPNSTRRNRFKMSCFYVLVFDRCPKDVTVWGR